MVPALMHDILHPQAQRLAQPSLQRLVPLALCCAVGFAAYGFGVGWWRSPLMALYVAIKMPLLIGLVLGCNCLLNGLLALVLGSGLGLRQSLECLLQAFAISALILGSLAPVAFLLAYNAPPPDSAAAQTAHAGYMLIHTALIGVAGCIGVFKLRKLLLAWCPNASIAHATLSAWVLGNAFIGAQWSWILRPFFGAPHLEVEFLRPNPMRGNFYETLWGSLQHFLARIPPLMILPATCGLILLILVISSFFVSKPSTPAPP
ncbi:MAG TPA: hypothetical protein VFY13_03350 [Luteolibacter sp.]|nr:hypothetical protein [Luteolibacter sp.]